MESRSKADARWSRMHLGQLEDIQFVLKHSHTKPTSEDQRDVGKHILKMLFANEDKSRDWFERLLAKKTKGGCSKELSWSWDGQSMDGQMQALDLLCTVAVFGHFDQHEKVALMMFGLKETMKEVETPQPFHVLLALQQNVMKKIFESTVLQQDTLRLGKKYDEHMEVLISRKLHEADTAMKKEIGHQSTDVFQSSKTSGFPSGRPSSHTGSHEAMQSGARSRSDAAMAARVSLKMLSSLVDPTSNNSASRQEALMEISRTVTKFQPLSLSSDHTERSLSEANSRYDEWWAQKALEVVQRFLLQICQDESSVDYASAQSNSYIEKESEESVHDRTIAVNCLVYLASATGSVNDFLMVVSVLLGVHNKPQGSDNRDTNRPAVFSPLSCSMSALDTLPCLARGENQWQQSKDALSHLDRQNVTGDNKVNLDSKNVVQDSSSFKRDQAENMNTALPCSTKELLNQVKRKALPKGFVPKLVGNISSTTSVHFASSPQATQQKLTAMSNTPSKRKEGMRVEDEQGTTSEANNVGGNERNISLTSQVHDATSLLSLVERKKKAARSFAACLVLDPLDILPVLVTLDAAPKVKLRQLSRPHQRLRTPANASSKFAKLFEPDQSEKREVWSCGQNSYGELGHGDTITRKTFGLVEKLQHKEVVQVCAGNEHTLALTANGEVYACGYNDNGQCALGHTSRVAVLTKVPYIADQVVTSVHAYNGCEHTVFLTQDGQAATSGYNYRGQLGHGNSASEYSPRIIRSLISKKVKLVSCSYYHTIVTCESFYYSESVYTFGRNDYGQLGLGDMNDRREPQPVIALGGQAVASISCGQYHSAVVTTSGDLYTFGKNDYGQIGEESLELQSIPKRVPVKGLLTEQCAQVSCGYYHSIVKCASGSLYGFGRNDYGQLGLGESILPNGKNEHQQRVLRPQRIESLSDKDITQVSCGCYHTVATSSNGVLYVFGRNNHGQLGTGDTIERLSPVAIEDFVGKRVAMVATGFYHTIVLTGGIDEESASGDKGGGDPKMDSGSTTGNYTASGLSKPPQTFINYSWILANENVQAFLRNTGQESISSLHSGSDERSPLTSLGYNAEVTTSFIDATTMPNDHHEVPVIQDTLLTTAPTSSVPPVNNECDSAESNQAIPALKSDSVFIAVFLVAELERISDELASRSLPTRMEHLSEYDTEKIRWNDASQVQKAHWHWPLPGLFEPYAVHAKSLTFETLVVLIEHVWNYDIDALRGVQELLTTQKQTYQNRPQASSDELCELQFYLLNACIKLVHCNIITLLRSGGARAFILLSKAHSAQSESTKEVHTDTSVMLRLRDLLLALANSNGDALYNEQELTPDTDWTSTVTKSSMKALMAGFELFFPCPCAKFQFILQAVSSDGDPRYHGKETENKCTLLNWHIKQAVPMGNVLRVQVLQQVCENMSVAELLPFFSQNTREEGQMNNANTLDVVGDSVDMLKPIYVAVVDQLMKQFIKELDEGLNAAIPLSTDTASKEVEAGATFLLGILKHLTSTAVTIKSWGSLHLGDENASEASVSEKLSSVIVNAFRFDLKDMASIPSELKCFIGFATRILQSCCDVFLHLSSVGGFADFNGEGYMKPMGDKRRHLESFIEATVESSIVGGVLPTLLRCLSNFSSRPLVSAALLPVLKILLRLLVRFNSTSSKAKQYEGHCHAKLNLPERKSTLLAELSTCRALPWNVQLERLTASIAANCAITIMQGDPLHAKDANADSIYGSVLANSKQLLRGGIQSEFLRNSLPGCNFSQEVVHATFQDLYECTSTSWEAHVQSMKLVVPPPRFITTGTHVWKHGASNFPFVNVDTYADVFNHSSTTQFLLCLSGEHRKGSELAGPHCCAAAARVCDWVRREYSRTNLSYRMLARTTLNSSVDCISVDCKLENAMFAALVVHTDLVAQCMHFVLGRSDAGLPIPGQCPKAFLHLWKTVASLRRTVASQATEIKNNGDFSQLSSLVNDQVFKMKEQVMKRCILLSLLENRDADEHRCNELDGGYVAPFDSGYISCTGNGYATSQEGSVKYHMCATYTDNELPFLFAYPNSRWKIVRTLVHVLTRWKSFIRYPVSTVNVDNAILAFAVSDADASSPSFLNSVLVDPLRRRSCSVQGIQHLIELMRLPRHKSVRLDIYEQVVTYLFSVYIPSVDALYVEDGSLFFAELHRNALFDLLCYVVECIRSEMKTLREAETPASIPHACVLLVRMLQCWSIRLTEETFVLVADSGILELLADLLEALKGIKTWLETLSKSEKSVPSDILTANTAINKLECTAWELFQHIYLQFTDQKQIRDGSTRKLQRPVYAMPNAVMDLLYMKMLDTLQESSGSKDQKRASTPSMPEAIPPILPSQPTLRRSFELIRRPCKFHQLRKGFIVPYNELLAPKVRPEEKDTCPPMAPLCKPNTFSMTMWLYIDERPAPSNMTNFFDSSEDYRLVFFRGNAQELSPYLLLRPEGGAEWYLELGLVRSPSSALNTENISTTGTIWERLVSKNPVMGHMWIHIGIVVEGMKLRLYVNGIPDSQLTLSPELLTSWSTANVDLPFHFGRIPSDVLKDSDELTEKNSVFGAIRRLLSSANLRKSENDDAKSSRDSHDSFNIQSFTGFLNHFRFHNRALSPIHVRIVHDEYKPILDGAGKKSNSYLEDIVKSKGQYQVAYDLSCILSVLAPSSEGIAYFSNAGSKWTTMLWKLFAHVNSLPVRQTILKALQSLLTLQTPGDASKAMRQSFYANVPACFYSKDSICIQSILQIIGFSLSGELNPTAVDANDEKSSTSLDFLSSYLKSYNDQEDMKDESLPWTSRANSSSIALKSLVAKELILLLQQLYKSSSKWSEAIKQVLQNTLSDRSNVQERLFYRINGITIERSQVERAEVVAALSVANTVLETLRPGSTVYLAGTDKYATLIAVQNTNQDTPMPPSPLPKWFQSRDCTIGAIVLHEECNISNLELNGWCENVDQQLRTLEQQMHRSGSNNKDSIASRCRWVNIDDLEPIHPLLDPVPIKATQPSKCATDGLSCLNFLVEEVIEYQSGDDPFKFISHLQARRLWMKALAHSVSNSKTAPNADELKSYRNIVWKLALETGQVHQFCTLTELEHKLSLLHLQLLSISDDLQEEGSFELAKCLLNKTEEPSVKLHPSGIFKVEQVGNRHSFSLNLQIDTSSYDMELPKNESDGNSNGSANADDVGEDDDLSNSDDSEDDMDDEETQAEFIEELMMMGFPEEWCTLALKQTGNDIVSASAWIVDNLDYLTRMQFSLEKRGQDEMDASTMFNDDDDDTDESKDEKTMQVLTPYPEQCIPTIESKQTVGILHDIETGRRTFGEMYFPFEEGGYRSNDLTTFFTKWRSTVAEAQLGSKRKITGNTSPVKPRSPERFENQKKDQSSLPLHAVLREFDEEVKQMSMQTLVAQLLTFEKMAVILYARKTLVHSFSLYSDQGGHTKEDFVQLFQLCKAVLFRGDQFSSHVHSAIDKETSCSTRSSAYDILSGVLQRIIKDDGKSALECGMDMCLNELEMALNGTEYEAYVWTQRGLDLCDVDAMQQPSVELSVWMLDIFLEACHDQKVWDTSQCRKWLTRLEKLLSTSNVSLKCITIHTLSQLLRICGKVESSFVESWIRESNLSYAEVLQAANARHDRELVQDRSIFSLYLQAYIELLYVIRKSDAESNFPCLTDAYDQSIQFLPPLEASPLSERHLQFDRKKARSPLLTISDNGSTVSYTGSELWKTVCAAQKFSSGSHTWEVRIERSSCAYLFIGVADSKRVNVDSFLGSDTFSWGYIGDQALYYQRSRVRSYGEHFGEGDVIGVHLDCEKGTLSFAKNGVIFGTAFENIVGEVCPAVALYSRNQRVSFVIDATDEENVNPDDRMKVGKENNIEHCVVICEMMESRWNANVMNANIVKAAFEFTQQWLFGNKRYVKTRSGDGLWVDVGETCCQVFGFQVGERVKTLRGDGRVAGVANDRLWVDIDGEDGAWFFHPSKLQSISSNSEALDEKAAKSTDSIEQAGIVATNITERKAVNDTEANEKSACANSHVAVDNVFDSSSVITLEVFNTAINEHQGRLGKDESLMHAVNEHCDKKGVVPWNLSASEVLSLLDINANRQVEDNSKLNASWTEKDIALLSRFGLLRYLNWCFSHVVAYFDLTWNYFNPKTSFLPSQLLANCRELLFTTIKHDAFNELSTKTAHATRHGDDDYDYPEDLPQILLNRPKAATAKCHPGTMESLMMSLVGQTFEQLHFLPIRSLRMLYSHPMDDGQWRSFKVKFEGEGVDDYGGPYREFFSQFFAELQELDLTSIDTATSKKDKIDTSVKKCLLPFFLPCPNWRNSVGDNREKFVLNAGLVSDERNERMSETQQLYGEMFHFIGQMLAIGLRTGICIRLDLAGAVWRQLVGVSSAEQDDEAVLRDMQETDQSAYTLWTALKRISIEYDELEADDSDQSTRRKHELDEEVMCMDLFFTTCLSDGSEKVLCYQGEDLQVTTANLKDYLSAVLRARQGEMAKVINIIKQGIHSILPVTALHLYTWTELEARVCGSDEIDINLLKENTEYDEDLSAEHVVVQRFWRVLMDMDNSDKRAFLRFVWARARLPTNSSQFHQKFKIQLLSVSTGSETAREKTEETKAKKVDMDIQLPKSHTCFFALQLPSYTTDEICRQRLQYAIHNCVEMDGDFRLGETEMTGWSGIDPSDQLRF